MDLLTALPELWPITALRQSWLVYAAVNATHILGIALLVGAIAVLDLRLLGAFRSAPLPAIADALWKTAATGLVLAIVSGALLFAVRPAEYLANPAFLTKLALVAAGAINALVVHRTAAWRTALAGHPIAGVLKLTALLSLAIWLSAIFAGRVIGFLM